MRELESTRKELDEAKQWKGHFESTQAKMLELELVIKELREELNAAITEKDETKEQAKNEKDELEEVRFFHFPHFFILSSIPCPSQIYCRIIHFCLLADKQETKRGISETKRRACRSKGGDRKGGFS